MRSLLALASVAALGAACAAGASTQQTDRAAFTPRPLASGFSQPVFVTGAKGEPGRLYVVEQGGTIQMLQNGKRRGTLLDIRRLVTAGGEQGLLGFAFHPSYPRVRKFYVQYTAGNGSTKVVEYRTNGTRASAPRQLFSSADPYGNHNGGMLAFGPNGRLYFTMGDGGAGGDPENRAQNMRSLFGKLLSMNVATKGLKIEALGLRNAWRFSFDRANGDLYIGDVGQGDARGDRLHAGSSSGLENYGWDVYEGRSRFEDKPLGPGQARPADRAVLARRRLLGHGRLRLPRLERGAAGPLHLRRLLQRDRLEPQGRRRQGDRRFAARASRSPSLTSFGEDAAGELYARLARRHGLPPDAVAQRRQVTVCYLARRTRGLWPSAA